MALTRKEIKQDQVMETAWNIEHWIEDNWRLIVRWIAIVALLVIVVLAGFRWMASRRAQAQRVLAGAMESYAQAGPADTAALEEALGQFESAAAKGGSGGSGRVARLYQARVLLDLGRADEAIAALEPIARQTENAVMDDAVNAMLGLAYSTAGRAEDAVSTYRALADGEGAYALPALLALADLHVGQGDDEAAALVLEEIGERFPDGPESRTAERRLNAINR